MPISLLDYCDVNLEHEECGIPLRGILDSMLKNHIA